MNTSENKLQIRRRNNNMQGSKEKMKRKQNTKMKETQTKIKRYLQRLKKVKRR
jgi:hypothetical protein